MTVRPATADDFDALLELSIEADQLHQTLVPGIFRATELPYLSRALVEQLVAEPNTVLLVADRDGRTIGFVVANAKATGDSPALVARRYVYVAMLAVLGRERRGGAGRALIEAVERWAAEHGICEIELNVWEANADAVAFYERLGYSTQRRTMWRTTNDGDS